MARIIDTFVNVNRNRVTNVADDYTISIEDDTVNYIEVSGTLTIDNDLFNIGKKLKVRKLNSSSGAVTINFINGTVTKSAKAAITLTSDGDFWMLEKVKSDRWELIAGYESIEHHPDATNGFLTTNDVYFKRFYDGSTKCYVLGSVATTGSEAFNYVVLPDSILSSELSDTSTVSTNGVTASGRNILEYLATSSVGLGVRSGNPSGTNTVRITYTGVWY